MEKVIALAMLAVGLPYLIIYKGGYYQVNGEYAVPVLICGMVFMMRIVVWCFLDDWLGTRRVLKEQAQKQKYHK